MLDECLEGGKWLRANKVVQVRDMVESTILQVDGRGYDIRYDGSLESRNL